MKIKHIQRSNRQQLIQRLRRVCMLNDPYRCPYEHAAISLETLQLKQLNPSQNYILKSELEKVQRLKWELEKYEVDIFKLDGYITMTLELDKEPIDLLPPIEPIDLLPPIIEEAIQRNGEITYIINDGMHRLYMAYLEFTMPQVVFIRAVPKHLPYYAYPFPKNDWSKLEIIDSLQPGYLKKWHRIKENKKLYRNFNSIFHNVGQPRKENYE